MGKNWVIYIRMSAQYSVTVFNISSYDEDWRYQQCVSHVWVKNICFHYSVKYLVIDSYNSLWHDCACSERLPKKTCANNSSCRESPEGVKPPVPARISKPEHLLPDLHCNQWRHNVPRLLLPLFCKSFINRFLHSMVTQKHYNILLRSSSWLRQWILNQGLSLLFQTHQS